MIVHAVTVRNASSLYSAPPFREETFPVKTHAFNVSSCPEFQMPAPSSPVLSAIVQFFISTYEYPLKRAPPPECGDEFRRIAHPSIFNIEVFSTPPPIHVAVFDSTTQFFITSVPVSVALMSPFPFVTPPPDQAELPEIVLSVISTTPSLYRAPPVETALFPDSTHS